MFLHFSFVSLSYEGSILQYVNENKWFHDIKFIVGNGKKGKK